MITGMVSQHWANQDIGIASNDDEPLYAAVSNSPDNPVVVVHDDPVATQIDTWTQWIIPLQTLAYHSIVLTNVDKIAIGFGSRGNMTILGGSGKMYCHNRPPQKETIRIIFSQGWQFSTLSALVTCKSRNIFFANEVFSAIVDYSVSLFRNILYISCCHRQINMTEKLLNCKWISRSCCHWGGRSAKSIEARSLRCLDVKGRLNPTTMGALKPATLSEE
jgi:hypothetical protein